MDRAHTHETIATTFFSNLFASRAAQDGAVVRRKVRDVERFVGRAAFYAEVQRRGFQLIENGGQFIVVCNREPLKVHF